MVDYVELLKAHGLKATFQRMHLLEVLHNHGHMDVEEIYAEVAKVHPSLSLATVYKNIIIMTKKGVLVEVAINGKKSKYEIAKEEHLHLVCTKCGSIQDVFTPFKAIENIDELEKFTVEKQEITLYGVCASCSSILHTS
ncbi:MAG TPA: transcriptional repressor [Epsilonproteobacteria bacterium]|nr:transcriptional repressor [Campylobacterota bacterium]